MLKCIPYGPRGWLLQPPGTSGRPRGESTLRWARAARALWPEADVVVGAGVVAVFDGEPRGDFEERLVALEAALPESGEPGARHLVEVIYDGPDRAELAAQAGLDERELIELHLGVEYRVEFLGFAPGFGYLSGLDERLRRPRRGTPRTRVAANSLAIAEGYTGIYPFDGPGGWHCIGRAPGAALFEPTRAPPTRWAPGDRVRFVECPRGEEPAFELRVRPSPAPPSSPWLMIERVLGSVTVQDLGRAGQRGAGIPVSGALDPGALLRANARVGNPPGAAGLEILHGEVLVRPDSRAVVSVDGAPPQRLEAGEALGVSCRPLAVRYLALEGGVTTPLVAGSRSTLPTARFGGHAGRPLRPGDRLPLGGGADVPDPGLGDAALEELDELEPLPILPGPHQHLLGEGALRALLEGRFHVSTAFDRIGQRLEGDRIPQPPGVQVEPTPLVRGAMQLTPDGTLIVFGPDHPITGGYPLLAVLPPSAARALARRAPGADVRFRLA